MELLKVLLIFAVLLLLLNRHFPLYIAMLCGTALLLVLFGIDPATAAQTALETLGGWGMWSVCIAMYVISVLVFQLKRRERFRAAQDAMNGLMKDARLNTAFACVFIGLMPGPATVTICGSLVDQMAGEHLSRDEKSAVAGFLRHIPEGIFPTFSGVIVACSISGIPPSDFFYLVIPMLFALVGITYFVYLRKVPKQESVKTQSKGESVKVLFKSLWSLFVAIGLIILFNWPTWTVVLGVVLLNARIERFSPAEVKTSFIEGFEYKTALGIIATYVFKDMLILAGVIEALPGYFARYELPSALVLGILYFFGTLVASTNAAAAAFIPLAYTMIPDGGVFLFVFLMGIGFAASQISPTHICTPIISDYFSVTFLGTVRKILPMSLLYILTISAYYFLLTLL